MSECHLSTLVHSFVITVIMVVFSWIGLADHDWLYSESLNHVAVNAIQKDQLSAKLLSPIKTLEKAKRVESKYIGVAAALSKNHQAFDEIMAHEQAEMAFEYLLAVDNTVSKVYAMQGFAALQSSRYEEARAYFIRSNDHVKMQAGCLVYEKPVSDLFQ